MSEVSNEKPGRALRVLLVDDDALVRGWLRIALDGSTFTLAGEAARAAEALELVERERPDLLIVDYRLEDGFGTEFVRELRRRGVDAPAIVVTASRVRGLNELARAAGAQGTLLKTGEREELFALLQAVASGKRVFDPRHPRQTAGRAVLSPREREVLHLVAAGSTNHEIAEELNVGSETVKTLLTRTFAKLGAHRRAEAVSIAQRQGLL